MTEGPQSGVCLVRGARVEQSFWITRLGRESGYVFPISDTMGDRRLGHQLFLGVWFFDWVSSTMSKHGGSDG